MFVIKDEEGNNALYIFIIYYFITLSMWNIHEYSNHDLHVVCWTQQTYLATQGHGVDILRPLSNSLKIHPKSHQISVNSLKPH